MEVLALGLQFTYFMVIGVIPKYSVPCVVRFNLNKLSGGGVGGPCTVRSNLNKCEHVREGELGMRPCVMRTPLLLNRQNDRQTRLKAIPSPLCWRSVLIGYIKILGTPNHYTGYKSNNYHGLWSLFFGKRKWITTASGLHQLWHTKRFLMVVPGRSNFFSVIRFDITPI